MTLSDKAIIKCGTHGPRGTAIVCRHMIQSKDVAVGFVENCADPDDLQAWCGACARFFLEEGDLTERFREFNDFAVVCDFRYANLKERHSTEVNEK